MPTVGVVRATRDAFGDRDRQFLLQGFRDSGSEVIEITSLDGATVYAAELSMLAGVVLDSTLTVPRPFAGAAVSIAGTDFSTTTDGRGRFQLAAPLSGQYTVTFSHTRLDSIGLIAPGQQVTLAPGRRATVTLVAPPVPTILAMHCPDTPISSTRRVLLGVVREGESRAPVAGARVLASWQRIAEAGGAVTGAVEWEATAVANSAGVYTLCGLPVGRAVTVRAEHGDMASGTARVSFQGTSVSVGWDGAFGRSYYAPYWVWKLDLLVRREK
jgi:hypothetical protein